ncbi:hypothetical protein [Streptomyces sp. NPDC005865]|uniref:hypothetical protein n=1 Tax=Streptomyces sp. NPDC005865 TaxID=3155453 RepID=UPI0033C3B6A7
MLNLSYAPGTDALHKITPLLLAAQELTVTALGYLRTLHDSAYTSITGSRPGRETLSATAANASLACTDLAKAISANPYEGAPFAGNPADDAQVHAARHAEAIPRMNSHINDAALQRRGGGCQVGAPHHRGAERAADVPQPAPSDLLVVARPRPLGPPGEPPTTTVLEPAGGISRVVPP